MTTKNLINYENSHNHINSSKIKNTNEAIKMKELSLKPLSQPNVMLEAEIITPDNFSGKSVDEIKQLKVWKGNKEVPLSDFFQVEGETTNSPEETRIVIEGSIPKTKRVGEGMTSGEIVIKGNAGMHTGALMRGGSIFVEGDVGAWSGAEIRGGKLHIKGNADNYLGAVYRGEWRGMRGGKIIVEGNAGGEVGEWMRDGVIHVKRDVGSFVGVHMHGGKIIVHGNADERVGAEMTGGQIIILGKANEILPSFRFDEEIPSIEVEGETYEGPFLKFVGDLAEAGKLRERYLFQRKIIHI